MRPCFQFFWVYTQSGIAGSYNSSIFNFGGNCYTVFLGFPDNFGGKEYACNAGDIGDSGSIPELGRSPGEGNGNPLQYSYQENSWTEKPGGLQSMGLQRVRHD